MTRLNNKHKTLNSLRSYGIGTSILAAVLLMTASLLATPAVAQDKEIGNTNGYRAEKTVDDYMNPGQQKAASDFDYGNNSMRVEVWVDKPTDDVYRKGEDISVAFQANQDIYAVVYRIDTEGLVTVLWPRSRFDDGFVFGGHEYQLPVSGARNLHVSTAEGQGIVEALVSQYPFDLRALELDFHHENTAERHNFRVAGDPFLAMNEVNYAVTGLEDSGEYVVTNYASYYVHQTVDHPRYLCNQCHVEDEVAYDPYRDDCTLTIEHDYSWYNGWYDRYGYYPVYGNPVYVYVDPWSYNPWVNYWYTPSYYSAPWYGWGWGWGACYSWNYSPYYYGNSVTAYHGGYTRYRPLDRTRITGVNSAIGRNSAITKTREYTRGSQMVRKSSLSDRDRGNMVSRTRVDRSTTDRNISVAGSRGRDTTYRGADRKVRDRSSFDQVATSGRSQGGLRIRESGSSANSARTGTETIRRRHTAAGNGQRSGLAPVSRTPRDADSWRGTTRVGGTSGSSGGSSSIGVRGRSTPPSTIGNSSRGRSSSDSKTVQPRKRSTRVWNSTSGRSGTSQGTSARSRSGTVNSRSRSGTTTNRSREAVSPRSTTKSGKATKSDRSIKSSRSNRSSKATSSSKSSGRSSGSVKSNSGSRGSSATKSSGSRSSGGSSSRGGSSKSSSGGSRSSGSRSDSSRR